MQSQAARESGLGRATKEVRRREDDPRNVGDMAVDREEEAPQGGRRGQTALNWNQRLRIIICIARAIDFIHAQLSPNDQNNIRMNVRGNIKSSNIIVNTDFTARLSDYGFLQLTDHCTEGSDHQGHTSKVGFHLGPKFFLSH
ncbi:hypothetical protein GOBAR_DD15347 [Gossypium barbadense]|nr:hypothetical protein GOBAR_DD15347 [Gossypium barbadense]